MYIFPCLAIKMSRPEELFLSSIDSLNNKVAVVTGFVSYIFSSRSLINPISPKALQALVSKLQFTSLRKVAPFMLPLGIERSL